MLRKLDPLEKIYFNPDSRSDIFFSVKFTEKKFVDKAIENFQKFFCGTRLKVIGDAYYKADTELQVMKMPNWIQEADTASIWAQNNIMTPLSTRLANIAANDNIVVVQSNHNISDGGFLLDVMKNVLADTSNLEPVSEPPLRLIEAFSTEIQNANRAYEQNPNLFKKGERTIYKYDWNDPHLATPGTKQIQSKHVIHSEDLMCYDKKTKRPKSVSEAQFASLAFTMQALCNYDPKDYKPMGIDIIADARRFMQDKSKINWRFGQCFASPTANAIPKKGDTVKTIMDKFKKSIKSKSADIIFHDLTTLETFLSPHPSQLLPVISSIGPIQFKRPIVDFDLRNWVTTTLGVGDNGKANGTVWSFISYSKINETKNDLIIYQLHDPSQTTVLNNKLLLESCIHFLTKIPLDTSYEDALYEIERFQKQIINDYK